MKTAAPEAAARPALRPPPVWAECFTSLRAAWQNAPDHGVLLAWLDEAGPTPQEVRRAIGRAALAVSESTLARFEEGPIGRHLERYRELARRGAEGKDVPAAKVHAIDGEIRALVVDRPRSMKRLSKQVFTQLLHVLRLAEVCALACLETTSFLWTGNELVHYLSNIHGSEFCEEAASRVRAAVLREVPEPPACYREPVPAARWRSA